MSETWECAGGTTQQAELGGSRVGGGGGWWGGKWGSWSWRGCCCWPQLTTQAFRREESNRIRLNEEPLVPKSLCESCLVNNFFVRWTNDVMELLMNRLDTATTQWMPVSPPSDNIPNKKQAEETPLATALNIPSLLWRPLCCSDCASVCWGEWSPEILE